ncbi:RnfABCDGE type electron transport complex subunit D [uncultured Abyssibacter sp.]|uniref:RnfABCDGE type electron transport complex subunit D n=1 Tax=uncultured Abyssibacter sp. TaxID=2320202 RepID=UPI0032B2915D
MNQPLSSPHLPVRPTVGGLMRRVLLAMIPGAAAMVICFGIGVLINLLVALAAALATEAALLRLRDRPLKPFLTDWTAVLTAALFALALPPLAPWWLTAIGAAIAIALGKQLYGGLGQNPFNPAMVGYVVVLISFPTEMTYWTQQPTGITATLQAQFGQLGAAGLDGLTGATPLDALRSGLAQERIVDEAVGGLAGRGGWAWINGGFLLGGLWLVFRRDISWRIPAAVLAGIGAMALLFWLIDGDRHASPWFHWTSGAAMLGAFFIATDPVSGATTPRGKLIFGAGIGVLVYLIRTWGGYPDGMAFAVLLMNLTVPLLDAHTQPRVYGR